MHIDIAYNCILEKYTPIEDNYHDLMVYCVEDDYAKPLPTDKQAILQAKARERDKKLVRNRWGEVINSTEFIQRPSDISSSSSTLSLKSKKKDLLKQHKLGKKKSNNKPLP
jgi:hypothetical protein